MNRIKNISIPGPCHQQWQQMVPVNGGRHCESCCKTVVDFTVMTDAQVISYLTSHNNVCGRLIEPQLARINLQLNGQDTKTKTGWKKWVMTTALLGSALLYKVSAQTTPATAKIDKNLSENYPAGAAKGKVVINGAERRIRGMIVNDACMPLPGATVRVVGTDIVLATDTNGRFKFHAPIAAKQFTVSFIGFETETVDMDSIQNDVREVKLTPQVVSINDVVKVIGYQVQRRADVTGAISVVTAITTTTKHCWLWRMYYKYIRTPIHNIFY